MCKKILVTYGLGRGGGRGRMVVVVVVVVPIMGIRGSECFEGSLGR